MLCWGHGEPSSQACIAPSFTTFVHSSGCRCKAFQSKHTINTIFQFTSSGAKLDPHMKQGVGSFRLCGSVYHLIGSLLPAAGQPARFAQLYCCDPQHELENRMVARPELNVATLATIQRTMHQHNFFAKTFKAAAATNASKFSLKLSSTDGAPCLDLNVCTLQATHITVACYCCTTLLLPIHA